MADRLAELGKIMGDGIGKSARHLSFEEQWWLYEKCRSLQARVEELEAALAGDAGNVIYFAEQQALDRAAEALEADHRLISARIIRKLKEADDG